MPAITDSNSGVYILELFASEEFQVNIKKFSGITLKKGYYYYIGSAQKNLKQRIERHLRIEKKIHWHIDHLTTAPSISTKNAYIIYNSPKDLEEEIANNFPSMFGGIIVLKGFGNSDTKGSITHLFYSKRRIPQSHFFSRYQSIVRFIASSKV
ncbi:MAG: GIY-YIG nuclease family protein [Bacteroidota bacterium]